MARRTLPYRLGCAVLTTVALSGVPSGALMADEGHVDLLGLMGTLQTMVHKTQLSLDADNVPLAAFYAHELEETGEAVSDVEEYDGHPIGRLTGSMLMPAIEALDEALRDVNEPDATATANAALDRVIDSCNACHAATQHGFIVIERNDMNPYAQRFQSSFE